MPLYKWLIKKKSKKKKTLIVVCLNICNKKKHDRQIVIALHSSKHTYDDGCYSSFATMYVMLWNLIQIKLLMFVLKYSKEEIIIYREYEIVYIKPSFLYLIE